VVLLAAGEGARFRASGGVGHKLLAPFRGRTVVEWAVDRAREAAIGPVTVVVGAVMPPELDGVDVVVNPDWADGMATSLQVGVRAAVSAGEPAVVVGLADQPLVEAEAWRRVARVVAGGSGAVGGRGGGVEGAVEGGDDDTTIGIAVATYGGVRGHPVGLRHTVWPHLPRTGDRGARTLMRAHPELVLEVPCPGCSVDVDTVEDLSRWS
jgi:molybdenum cofactor cytidylyltransferase